MLNNSHWNNRPWLCLLSIKTLTNNNTIHRGKHRSCCAWTDSSGSKTVSGHRRWFLIELKWIIFKAVATIEDTDVMSSVLWECTGFSNLLLYYVLNFCGNSFPGYDQWLQKLTLEKLKKKNLNFSLTSNKCCIIERKKLLYTYIYYYKTLLIMN